MPLKPVHQRGNCTRNAMWNAMLELETFTTKDIGKATLLEDSSIGTYLAGLIAAGFVTVEKKPVNNIMSVNIYTLFKRQKEPPRVRKDGSAITQGQATENMWRTMKMADSFTSAELAISASTADITVTPHYAKSYIRSLKQAGYLKVLRAATTRKQAAYSLLIAKNSGPKAPQVQRSKQVYDPNLGKVVWSENAEVGDE